MEFDRVAQVSVTTLVENSVNPFLAERDGVRRRGPKEGNFLAEHGWAALIETTAGGEKHAILLDVGLSETALLHNMSCLKMDPSAIEAVVISHGHGDHTGSVVAVVKRAGKPLPVYVHPAAFRERWWIPPDAPRRGPWRVKPEAWEAVGGRIVTVEAPYKVAPGCVVSGSIPRLTGFEGPPRDYYYRQDEAFHPETLPDDQAVVVAVKDKGLMIVSGCAHAGIVNTVRHAQKITGEERVWAIVGGFHLARASGERIEATIAGLKAVQPAILSPGHCTGFEALCAFARAMPDQFVRNVVGTVISTEGVEL
ncbi:MAG: MBL fold metallo-hydrolase [Anaerolineae bacterium]|nr:MAG: MBL fold metallo-hydrolase [Anaerolineae bacterium]